MRKKWIVGSGEIAPAARRLMRSDVACQITETMGFEWFGEVLDLGDGPAVIQHL